MSKRALILILSVVVIGLTLAGLQGILNLLANRGPLENTGSRESITSNGQTVPTKSVLPSPPPIDQPQPKELPFDITQLSGLASAFPVMDISPAGGLCSHIPLFKLSGRMGTSYLRSTVASVYQNKVWKYDTSLPVSKYKGEKLNFSVEGYARKSLTNIEVSPVSNFAASKMPIPVAQYVNKLTSTFPVSYDANNRIFVSDSGMPAAYSFEAIKYVFDNETYINAKIDPVEQYLEVPQAISERTIDLAQTITQGINSPYLKAKAIEQYLKNNYTYDFNYRPATDDWDPNEWFLFEEPKGVRSNFNSAFVVLARAAGIPARLVGGYFVDSQSDSQVVYADQAHAWSEIKLDQLGWVTMDATGSNLAPLIETITEITKVDSSVDKNTTFVVKGTVSADAAEVDGVLVGLYINQSKTIQNGTLIGQTLVKANNFEIEAKIPNLTQVGNYQLIARSKSTPRFAESTSDPIIKVMSPTLLNLSNVPRVKTTQVITINGELVETSKQALSGQFVDIFLNDKPLTKVTTDSKGRFEYQSSFSQSGKYAFKAQYKGSEFYYPCEQTTSFLVLTSTTLTIQAPPKLKAGKTLKIEGFLKSNSDMKPVANQNIELFVDAKTTGIKAKSDDSGHFVIEHKMKNSGIFQIDAKYISQPYYWDASASAAIEILAANNKTILGMLLMLSGAVIASGYVGFKYYRKHKPLFRRKNTTALTPPPVELPQAAAVEPAISQNNRLKLEIGFPGIVQPLPDVWGIGDDFDVACQLRDVDGQPMTAKPIEISMGSPITTLTTDNTGSSMVTLAFSEKGFFEIEAAYLSGNENEPGSQVFKMIRIVDYREEIIAEYKTLLEWFSQKDVSISQDISPREAEQLILNSGLPVSPDSVETVIACFEEATYSMHPITRQNYVKMHFAHEEIRENERQPEQPPE